MLKIISSRGQVVEGMSQLPLGVLPTVIDEDVGNSTSNPNENLDDPELHKPEGEQHLLQVPLMAPSSKRQRTVMQEQQHSSSSTGQFPQNFMVKWVLTENDLVPFVMDKDSKVVYCDDRWHCYCDLPEGVPLELPWSLCRSLRVPLSYFTVAL